jgi:ADP-heptose:LPS heptosyltransferase
MIKHLWRKYGFNPLDRMIKLAKKKDQKRILICWNRGMGDIALGLYGLNYRIWELYPDAQITYLTRADLAEGFQLLNGIEVKIDPDWKRHVPFDLDHTLIKLGLKRSDFDLILEKPDPTNWLIRQRGALTPKLTWRPEWDSLCERFSVDPSKHCVGVHVQTETFYSSYDRNWPLDYWKELFTRITTEKNGQVLLFGFSPNPPIDMSGVIDLRGQTSLCDVLSLVKNRCQALVLPDSGPLAMSYYLDCSFPIRIVSLWADKRHGVLKQNVPSPNPYLIHLPLFSSLQRDLSTLAVEQVFKQLYPVRS